MSLFFKLFISFIILKFVAIAQADQIKENSSGEKFFYSFPEEAGNDWIYAVPECSQLTKELKNSFTKCETVSNHEICITKSKIELTNISTNKKQKFRLRHLIFKSKKACTSDRESALSSE
jgi:hypothetical protein